MRGFILGIVILMAAPEYAVGQQRDRSGQSTTGRTAVPREETVQAVPARQADRRAEPRGETRPPSPRDEKSDDAAAATRASREPNSSRISRLPSSIAPLNPGFVSPLNPGFLSPLNPGFGQVPYREQRRPGERGDYRPRYRRLHSVPNTVFVPYVWPVVIEREVVIERDVVVEAPGEPGIVEQPSLARLILDVDPPTAQVFADGSYIGIPEDFRLENGGAMLEPGPHRIDILARDYEPVSVDVNLTRGQSATFRHILMPIVRTTQPAPGDAVTALPVAKQPSTFYLIPGCYIGNVPPKDANLPATCDIARAVSFQY